VPEARGDAQKEVLQAEAYRDQVIARAEGETRRFNKLLTEYRLSKSVTRDRLYIDALETVLSRTTKILVDVKGSNNMLYLPLDKLMERRAPQLTLDEQRQSAAARAPAQPAEGTPVPPETVEARRDRGTR